MIILVKILKIAIPALLALGGIIWYLLTHIAPYMIINPPRITEKFTPEDYGLAYEKLAINSIDSLKISAFHIKAKSASNNVIILVHGIGSCKEHLIPSARMLSEMNINAIALDLRAHGESDGQYCTYGYYEKHDIRRIVDNLLAENPEANIGIWGNSLGGAVALQALEDDKRIKFGIVESTFTELDKIVFDYQKRFTGGIGFKSVTDYVLRKASKIASFDPNVVKPIISASNLEQPVFLAHGDSDDNISVTYGKELFQALTSAESKCFIVAGGEHWGLAETGGEKYVDSIKNFISKNAN